MLILVEPRQGFFSRPKVTTWCCSLAQAAHNLGALYLHKRMYERALALLEEAKGIRLHALGSDDPDSAATLHLLLILDSPQISLSPTQGRFWSQ